MANAVRAKSFGAPGAKSRVECVQEVEPLAREWDNLAQKTKASPYARPGWFQAWWSAFGSGELCVFTYRQDDELRVVLPLFRRHGRLYSCSNVHSPRFDVAYADPDDLRSLLVAVLRNSPVGLSLSGLDVDGQLMTSVRYAAEQGRCWLLQLEASASARIDPTESWEEFELSLNGDRRRESRRMRRRLSERGDLRYEVFDGAHDLSFLLAEFFRLEGSGWKKAEGTAICQHPEVQKFYEGIAAWAANEGLLRLGFTKLTAQAIATSFQIDDGCHRDGLKIGYDESYSRFGPGILHQLEEVKQALDDGCSLELGFGAEAHKIELQNASRRYARIGLFPRTIRGSLALLEVKGGREAYRRARASSILRRGRDTARRALARGRKA